MTINDRTHFEKEFKLEAVRLANDSGKKVTEVARDLDLKVELLYKWQAEVKKKGAQVFSGSGHSRSQEKGISDELACLKKENARLREELDILKKATAFFTREN